VLCGLIDLEEGRNLNIDMLADRVYSRYDEQVTPDAIRYRRIKLIEACAEINELNFWQCKVIGRGQNANLLVNRKVQKDVVNCI
jgi:hypothetical protein